jgi:hypothetical protein
MNKAELLMSAGAMLQPSVNAANEYEEKREFLANEMNRKMKNRTDLFFLIGEGNTEMMEDNHRNHARFLSSIFFNYQPQILVETVIWVFRAYRSHGFNLSYWPAQLSQWVELLKVQLSTETFNEIYPFYNWLIVNQPLFVIASDKLISNPEIHSHNQ